MDLKEAVTLVVADQREGDPHLSTAAAVAQLRNVVVPWDHAPVIGAVRADYDPDSPLSVAVDLVLRADEDALARETADPDDAEAEETCPACGDLISFCQGHGEIGDPEGRATLDAHDEGDHSGCVGNCE